jgi:hypothetical protein
MFRYGDPCGPGLAFHESCHAIWLEETDRR